MADSIELTEQQIKSKRTVYLCLSTLVLLFLGLIYAFSMFAKPMIQDFGLSGVGITFNIMMIAFCTGCVGGSFVDKKLGVRNSLIVCAILFAIGFIGTGLLTGNGGMTVLYICYAVFGGLGCGVGYNTIVATTNVWFPDKVGFSSGVMMMGFGVSSLIFGNLALTLRSSAGIDMGMILVIIGIVVTILVLMLAFVLKRPPSNIIAVMAPEKLKGSGTEIGEDDKILSTPIFYIYYLWGIIIIAVGLAIIGNCAQDAGRLGAADTFASLLVGLVSTFNGLSRLVIGAIYDKTNIKVTMFVDALIAVVAVALIVVGFMSSILACYVVGALLCGFAYGGVPVIASAFARQRYGAKKYPVNLSIVNFAIAFGSFLNIAVGLAIGADNRLGIFVVILVFAVIALIDVLPFSRMWKKDVEEVKA